MTSTDFAARYRLLKNVATRGARSFLAQQVALGRMVMVHYLDSETPEQRSATLARLDALRPPAREKLLEVVDVDGSPVAVTLFISSFADFATWLDQVSPAVQTETAPAETAAKTPGEFTRMFSKIETPAAPPVMAQRIEHVPQRQAPPPPPAQPPAARAAGDFTRIFGKVDAGGATPEPAARAEAPQTAARDELDAPTLIIEASKVTRRAAPPAPPAPPAAPPAMEAGGSGEGGGGAGFTAIFGRVGETRLPDNLPPETPKPAAPAAGAGRVMQPPVPEFHQSTAPLPPASAPPSPTGGEFTQLFQRLSATPSSPPSVAPPTPSHLPSALPPMMSPPSFGLATEMPRPVDQPARSDILPPAMPTTPPMVLPPPSLGAPAASTPSLASSLPAPMLGMSPPVMPPSGPRPPDMSALPNVPPSAPIAPPIPQTPWNATPSAASGGSIFGGGPAQSEYTRILGKVVVPPPPPVSIQPPAAANATAASQKPKSMLPLIVALNVLVLLTVAIVAYFVFRK